MSWATTGEVLSLTGATVTDDQIAQAQGVIDLCSGVTEDVEDLSARDQRLLRYAVSYQTVWMAAQIDVLTRTEVAEVDQDGAKVVLVDTDALLLAPLARRALMGLSWNRRNRSIQVCPAGRRTFDSIEAYSDAWLRDETSDGWRSL